MHRPVSLAPTKKIRRKNVITTVFVLVIAGFVLNLQSGRQEQMQAKALAPLYGVLVTQDFDFAKFEGQTLYAYDRFTKERQEAIPLSLAHDQVFDSIDYMAKSGDCVFFILGGTAEDSWGIVFSDSHTVSKEGLKTLRPIKDTDSAYYFSTRD